MMEKSTSGPNTTEPPEMTIGEMMKAQNQEMINLQKIMMADMRKEMMEEVKLMIDEGGSSSRSARTVKSKQLKKGETIIKPAETGRLVDKNPQKNKSGEGSSNVGSKRKMDSIMTPNTVLKTSKRKQKSDIVEGKGEDTLAPFSRKIYFEEAPDRQKWPVLESYWGFTDPKTHVRAFEDAVDFHRVSDGIKCRLFLLTFKDDPRMWFDNLEPGSITSFKDFKEAFIGNYASLTLEPKKAITLLNIKQYQTESLRDFITRFNREKNKVRGVSLDDEVMTLTAGLRPGNLHTSILRRSITSRADLNDRIKRYIIIDDTSPPQPLVDIQRDIRIQTSPVYSQQMVMGPPFQTLPPQKEAFNTRTSGPGKKNVRAWQKKNNNPQKPIATKGDTPKALTVVDLPPLITSLSFIVAAIKGKGFYEKPPMLKAPYERSDSSKYCSFHEQKGHDTEQCYKLKQLISKLIKEGHLSEFLANGGNGTAGASNSGAGGGSGRERHCNVIIGEPRKVVSQHSSIPKEERNVKAKVGPSASIIFDNKDMSSYTNTYDDAVVVEAVINQCEVRKILVDTGSSVNVIFRHLADKIGLSSRDYEVSPGVLRGFNGEGSIPEGEITLPVCWGEGKNYVTYEAKFVVLNINSPYNCIFGRPLLNQFDAFVSTKRMMIKIPAMYGTATIKCNADEARQCYVNTWNPHPTSRVGPNQTKVEGGLKSAELELNLQMVSEQRESVMPGSTTEEVPIVEGKQEGRMLVISSQLQEEPEFKLALIQLLRQSIDVFAWEPSEMPGVDTRIISHSLNIREDVYPVAQKKRKSAQIMQNEIREEVQKLLKAKFIRPVQYPEWVSNVVMVPKHTGKWRMCVDFSRLNNACPKDSYPLPSIDQLVDSVVGHTKLSFLDAFSGYHQIKMNPSDEEKTAFITNEGTFCYAVMPFGLKNAGATYQRLMDCVFEHQKGRNVEVYVDDILVKSKSGEDHITDLAETFNTLRHFNIKLNPTKCVFGASSGKFLGYLVSAEGIQMNPDKVQAVLELEVPNSVKSIQKLTGKMAALSRFISRSAEKCAPLFKGLRGKTKFVWDEQCQESYDKLKSYLANPPVLASPEVGEILFMYLGVGEVSVSAVLIKESSNVQKPVYYVSRTLTVSERNYSPLEKLAYALVISARRLRPYFQSHIIKVVTDRPLKQILSRPEVSGRLSKWSIELGEFEIYYIPRLAIKAQVLADFICDFTVPLEIDLKVEDTWVMHVDGASGIHSHGIGVVLRSPAGIILLHSGKLAFEVTNNQSEYEALINGLRFALGIGVKFVNVYCDSQLIVNHVKGIYEARESVLIRYLSKVRIEISRFQIFTIQHISRNDNQLADLLAKYGNPHSATTREILVPTIDEVEEEVIAIGSSRDWTTPIVDYIYKKELPSNKEQQKKIRRRALRYFMHEGILYRKSFAGISLRCLPLEAVPHILEEVHEGICGGHQAGSTMAKMIIRQGYYWPTLQQDAINYAKKCNKCQIHANILQQPSQLLQPIVGPWPFAIWGMDFIGPLPSSTGGKRFLLVLIDYFTKWIEAVAVVRATADVVVKFLWNNIFCRYGMPLAIVTDNGTQFNNRQTIDFCQDHLVSLRFASVSHPQSNGQAEAANKIILTMLKKKLEDRKGLWAVELSSVLWAYRTTPNAATGETPFTLSFGAESVTPIELMIPSGRTQEAGAMDERQFTEWQQNNNNMMISSLEVLDEVRDGAQRRIFANKEKVRRYFNKKVRPRHFLQGDLVLRKLSAARDATGRGKLSSNWGGPYIIKKVIGSGAYKLQDADGNELMRTWNGNDLKIYRS